MNFHCFIVRCYRVYPSVKRTPVDLFPVWKNNQNLVQGGGCFGMGRKIRRVVIQGLLVFPPRPVVVLACILEFFVVVFFSQFLQKDNNKWLVQQKWRQLESAVGWEGGREFSSQLYSWRFFLVLVAVFVFVLVYIFKRYRETGRFS